MTYLFVFQIIMFANLAIWRNFVWQFGAILFGNLARFCLVIWRDFYELNFIIIQICRDVFLMIFRSGYNVLQRNEDNKIPLLWI